MKYHRVERELNQIDEQIKKAVANDSFNKKGYRQDVSTEEYDILYNLKYNQPIGSTENSIAMGLLRTAGCVAKNFFTGRWFITEKGLKTLTSIQKYNKPK